MKSYLKSFGFIFYTFLVLSVSLLGAKTKKKKFFEKLSVIYFFSELEKQVKQRDQLLEYIPSFERKTNCEHTEILYQEMPWDKKGLYPVPFLDIRVLCKSEKEKIIFVVGDSITGGVGLPREATYPAYLNQKFQSTVFVNAGINGSNTYHWHKGGILFDRIIIQNKEFIDGVILLIGGNNILFTQYVLKQKVNPEFIVQEIKNVIHDIQLELPNIPIYLGNYPVPHVMSEEMYEALEDLRKNTDGTIGGPEVRSYFENRPDLFLKDYLHLNTKGQKLMGIIWEEFLKKEGWK